MNKLLFKLHRWAALAAFAPLLVICLSGSILVFKHEIDALLMHDTVRVVANTEGRRSLDALFSQVTAALPGHEVTGWAWFDDRERADVVYVIAHGASEWQYILLDPYRGTLLSPVLDSDSNVTDWLLSLHYTLLADGIGMLISGAFSVLLCLLGITGLWLYRHFWKRLFTLRWHARRVVAFSDLHKLVGTLASPVLLILGFTGAWWNLEHGAMEVAEHWQEDDHPVVRGPLFSRDISLNRLLRDSHQAIAGFEATYLRLPWEPGIPIAVFGRVPTGNPLSSDYSSVVTFDAITGRRIDSSDIRTAGPVTRFEDTFRELHFGTFGGLLTRALWSVLGSAPAILTLTGLWLWWFRRSKVRRHKV